MIQVSHSSELAPAGHLFYDAKEENKHDQNLRDYLRGNAPLSLGQGGPTNSSVPGVLLHRLLLPQVRMEIRGRRKEVGISLGVCLEAIITVILQTLERK